MFVWWFLDLSALASFVAWWNLGLVARVWWHELGARFGASWEQTVKLGATGGVCHWLVSFLRGGGVVVGVRFTNPRQFTCAGVPFGGEPGKVSLNFREYRLRHLEQV